MEAKTILCMSAAQGMLSNLSSVLDRDDALHVAADAVTAFEILQGEDFNSVICDAEFDSRDGIDLLKRVEKDHPDVMRLLAIEPTDIEAASAAAREGVIHRFIVKSYTSEELWMVLRDVYSTYRLHLEVRDLTEKVSSLTSGVMLKEHEIKKLKTRLQRLEATDQEKVEELDKMLFEAERRAYRQSYR